MNKLQSLYRKRSASKNVFIATETAIPSLVLYHPPAWFGKRKGGKHVAPRGRLRTGFWSLNRCRDGFGLVLEGSQTRFGLHIRFPVSCAHCYVQDITLTFVFLPAA